MLEKSNGMLLGRNKKTKKEEGGGGKKKNGETKMSKRKEFIVMTGFKLLEEGQEE
jgi:hypothetical protein